MCARAALKFSLSLFFPLFPPLLLLDEVSELSRLAKCGERGTSALIFFQLFHVKRREWNFLSSDSWSAVICQWVEKRYLGKRRRRGKSLLIATDVGERKNLIVTCQPESIIFYPWGTKRVNYFSVGPEPEITQKVEDNKCEAERDHFQSHAISAAGNEIGELVILRDFSAVTSNGFFLRWREKIK